jgi:hypothetical protein
VPFRLGRWIRGKWTASLGLCATVYPEITGCQRGSILSLSFCWISIGEFWYFASELTCYLWDLALD